MGTNGRERGAVIPGRHVFLWGSRQEREEYLARYLATAREQGLEPDQILVLTFYQETRDRLGDLLRKVFPRRGAGYRLATLHSFCMELLNREGYRMGLGDHPELMGGWREFIVLKNLLPGLTPRGYDPYLWGRNGFVRQVLAFFNHLLGQGITAGELRQKTAASSRPQLLDLAAAYTGYTDFCRQEGYLPLAAAAPAVLNLLREYPQLKEQVRGDRQLFLAADLDQLEPVQIELTRLLAGAFPGALGLAYKYSPRAAGLAFGEFIFEGKEPGGKYEWREYDSWEEETWAVAGEIGRLLVAGEVEPSEVAIFLGAPSHRQAYARVLTAAGIPCRSGPEEELRRDPVLGFLLDYLEALEEPEDNERQVRWLSSPLLGLDGVWLRRTYYQVQGQGQKLLDMLVGSEIKGLVETFQGHLRGLRAGTISPLTIIEELCETHRLFCRYLDRLETGEEGQEAFGILANLREFLLLARECEGLSRLFLGREPNLTQFLEQIRGALPYLNTAVRAAAPRPGGVVLAPLRDACRYSPRVAFLVGLAADLYPPQRIPSSLLDQGGWAELAALFPHLALPADLDPHRFREEHRATLGRALALGDQVWISCARSYPGLEETGPSDLLLEETGHVAGEKTSGELLPAWPEPEPGAATAGRLGRFYLRQVGRIAPSLLPRAREELAGLGIAPGEPPALAGGRREPVAGLDYFTPSSIKNFLACPRRYYYQNILGLDIPAHPRARMGLALHRVLEEFHRRLPTLAGVPEETARACLKEVLARVWAEVEPALGRGLLAGFFYQELSAICRAYLDRELAAWEEGRLAQVEETLDFYLGGCRLRGRLDRLDQLPGGSWEIIDYKTGKDRTEGQRKREFLPREGERPEDLQLIIYYVGARERGLPLTRLTWYQLRELLTGGRVKRSLSLGDGKQGLSGAELAEAEGNLLAVLSEMQAGEYPPAPREERTCRDCPFKFPCPGPGIKEEAGQDD
jgi:RecB family exonuclease